MSADESEADDEVKESKTTVFEKLIGKLDFSVETKAGILNIATWLTMAMYLLFFDIFLEPIRLPNQEGSYIAYLFLAFVPQAVQILLFGGDTIAHSGNLRSVFFQANFPANQIRREHDVTKDSSNFLWFSLYHSKAFKDQRRRTFKYGYTCRLVYYLYYICLVLLGACIGSFTSRAAWLHIHSGLGVLESLRRTASAESPAALKILFLTHILLLALYLRFGNRVRMTETGGKRLGMMLRLRLLWKREERKSACLSGKYSFEVTGVWARWSEINGRHREWLTRYGSSKEALEEFATKESGLHFLR